MDESIELLEKSFFAYQNMFRTEKLEELFKGSTMF